MGLHLVEAKTVYGSTFFVTTGFHGLHVTIGTIFLIFCLIRSLVTTVRIQRITNKFLRSVLNYFSYFSFKKNNI